MTEFTNYINPALLVLIPVLYIIGKFIKQSEKIRDNYIPAILGGLGVLLAVLWVLSTSDVHTAQGWFLAAFTAFVQGILCAGAAVYANQLIKQAGDGK